MLVSGFFVAAVIVGAALVPIGWSVWEARRRALRLWTDAGRFPGLVRSAFAVATVCAVLLASAATINRHYSYILDAGALVGHVSPDLGHRSELLAASATEPLHGVVRKVLLGGMGFTPKPLYVYLPPEYLDTRDPERRFPVLYLLHGSPGIAVDWIRAGRVDRAMDRLLRHDTIQPFLVVMPDFDLNYHRDTQCEDIPDGPQMQTYLTHDVVNYIDGHYRTIPDRRARIIGGFSAGAYCGLNLTMRHQDVFSAFYAQSGYTRPDENPYTRSLFAGSETLLEENSPADYLTWMPIDRPLGGYVEAGTGDPDFRAAAAWIVTTLRARGATVTFRLYPGPDHGWSDCREHAAYMLRWASSWFSGPSGSGKARTVVTSTSWRRPTRI